MHIWYTGFLFVKQGANENVFDQSNSEHISGIQPAGSEVALQQ